MVYTYSAVNTSSVNDGQGDGLRTAMTKVNNMLQELMVTRALVVNGNQSLFYATPYGGAGYPSFRAINNADLPTVSGVSGTFYVANITIDSKGLVTGATEQGSIGCVNPPGSILTMAVSTVPTGYLECNGQAISRTTYAALFTAIGTVFGVGDNSTTFNVPDYRGYFLRAWDDGRGVDTGRVIGSTQDNANLAHTHTYEDVALTVPTSAVAYGSPGAGLASSIRTSASSGGTEARPKNIAVMYCIKY